MPLKFNEPNSEDIVGLYIITPTYPRPEQLPELTRLSQTLMVNINKYILHRNFDEKKLIFMNEKNMQLNISSQNFNVLDRNFFLHECKRKQDILQSFFYIV